MSDPKSIEKYYFNFTPDEYNDIIKSIKKDWNLPKINIKQSKNDPNLYYLEWSKYEFKSSFPELLKSHIISNPIVRFWLSFKDLPNTKYNIERDNDSKMYYILCKKLELPDELKKFVCENPSTRIYFLNIEKDNVPDNIKSAPGYDTLKYDDLSKAYYFKCIEKEYDILFPDDILDDYIKSISTPNIFRLKESSIPPPKKDENGDDIKRDFILKGDTFEASLKKYGYDKCKEMYGSIMAQRSQKKALDFEKEYRTDKHRIEKERLDRHLTINHKSDEEWYKILKFSKESIARSKIYDEEELRYASTYSEKYGMTPDEHYAKGYEEYLTHQKLIEDTPVNDSRAEPAGSLDPDKSYTRNFDSLPYYRIYNANTQEFQAKIAYENEVDNSGSLDPDKKAIKKVYYEYIQSAKIAVNNELNLLKKLNKHKEKGSSEKVITKYQDRYDNAVLETRGIYAKIDSF